MITASQLRAARGLLDWSRAQCAKVIGVSAETIKNIEQGKFVPAQTTVEKILSGFAEHGVEFYSQHVVALKDTIEAIKDGDNNDENTERTGTAD